MTEKPVFVTKKPLRKMKNKAFFAAKKPILKTPNAKVLGYLARIIHEESPTVIRSLL
jgi:hypothetical protein